MVGTTDEINEFNKRFNIKFDFKEDWEYALLKSDSSNKKLIAKISVPANKVPNVKGMLLDDAISILENKGLKVVFAGKGKVVAQSISSGSQIIKGSLIQLTLN